MTSKQKLHLSILAVITFCLLVIGWLTDHGGPLNGGGHGGFHIRAYSTPHATF